MSDVVEFFTDKGGVFAAIVAALGAILLLERVIQRMIDVRRYSADVCVPEAGAQNPPAHSDSGVASCVLLNSGSRHAVVDDLLLVVTDHGPTAKPKMIDAAAPMAQYSYAVDLDPGVDQYDVWARQFGSEPPHGLEPDEGESFVVELRSGEPQWYEFHFLARWYDTKSPKKKREVTSGPLRVEFLPSVEDVVGIATDEP